MSDSTNTENTVDSDYLNMSDEEMLNAPMPTEELHEAEETNEDSAAETENEDNDSGDADEGAGTAPEDAENEAEDNVDDDNENESKSVDGEDLVNEKPDSDKKVESKVDFEAEYKRILAPFKANGRKVEVKSVDDAITLMQMGANYNKKMAALKPNLKVLKLLENNGLLDESKLSFLIELDRKNPEAINKLVKDSGIDPMDFDAEKAGEYQPRIHTVDDREIALDTVLDDIQHTDSYTRTLGIVSKEWDGASKQVIADHPQLLQIINDHVARGIYDVIHDEVENERMLGRLTGLSDLEAYRQVGDAIEARGGFNHLGRSQEKSNTPPKVIQSKPKQASNDELKDKKRAASSSKPGAASRGDGEYNPLSMSDEEFSKLAETRFR